MSKLKTTIAALALATTAVGMSACSEKPAEKVAQSGTPQPTITVTVEPTPTETPTDDSTGIVDDTGDGELVDDAPPPMSTLGDTYSVGDWDVKITKVTLNANSQIAHANMFNDKPKGQYVLVNYEAVYTGSKRTADVESDLSWSFTDAKQVVHDEASVGTPASAKDAPTETRKGGKVVLDLAFDIPTKQVKGGIVSVQDWVNDVYADFPI